MTINLDKLHQYIAEYKQLIQTPDYDELYKWEAARKFNDNWKPKTGNVAQMLDKCLNARWNNLWAGNQFFLKRMLLELARADGPKVLSLFNLLFDETRDLESRALTFREEMGNLGDRVLPGRSVFQDDRAIMLYLGLRFPAKYPLYKFEMFKNFAGLVDYDEEVKRGSATDRFRPLRQYLQLCEIVQEELTRDTELLAIHRKLLDEKLHYTGEYDALLTQDFIYCTAEYVDHTSKNHADMVGESEVAYESRFIANTDLKKRHFWWLNANPKIWSIGDTQIGETQDYTSSNEKGNKRQKYKYFTQVQPGDVIVGYETTPVKKIRALFEITQALHQRADQREAISFKKILDLHRPIDYDFLKNLPDLKNCEPLLNNQGSLFRLTEEEYDVIQDIIDTQTTQIEKAEQTIRPYTKADALQDLFMPEASLDHLVQALHYKKNIVLQGAPGVGKTFVAKRLAQYLSGSDDPEKICMVQFHQSFGYEEFIMGIRPDAHGRFTRKKGLFYEFCERAQDDPGQRYFLIIDEINRGNLSKIFGELMLLIEADKRGEAYAMPLMYSEPGETFYVPENLYLIGAMNTADRSLALVDYALRRRFAFINLSPEFGDAFAAYLLGKNIPKSLIDALTRNVREVNRAIEADPNLGKGFLIGHSYFCQLEYSEDGISPEAAYLRLIEWEIAPQLREYWFDNEDRANAMIERLLDI